MIVSFIILLILQLSTPYWWWVIVVPFFYGLFRPNTAGRAIFAGLGSAGLLWFSFAFYHYFTDASLIAERVSAMMELSSPILLLVITTISGMLSGGFACLSGFFIRKAVRD